MTAPALSPYYVRVGDDWPVPFAFTNPDGTPIDLTGATALDVTLFQKSGPSWLIDGSNGSVVIDAPTTLGTGSVLVRRGLAGSITAQPATTTVYTLGLSFSLTDSANIRKTYRPQPIVPLSFQDFADLVDLQAAAILVLYQQGPAGGGQTINGHVGSNITLNANDVGAYTKPQTDAVALARSLIFG